MDHDEYIKAVKNNLSASYFDRVLPEGAFGIDVKKRFLGIPYGEDEAARAFVDQFLVFEGMHENPGATGPYDRYEIIIIFEEPVSNVMIDQDLNTIQRYISLARDHATELVQPEREKVFIQFLFAGLEITPALKKLIKNGAMVDYPDLAFLPVLADLDSGRLTYQTEQLDEHGLTNDPFIDQIGELAAEYFQVYRE